MSELDSSENEEIEDVQTVETDANRVDDKEEPLPGIDNNTIEENNSSTAIRPTRGSTIKYKLKNKDT